MNTPRDNELHNEPQVDRVEQRSQELFDQQVANMDARTRSRLNQARQAALDAARGPQLVGPVRWLLPVGSAAAVALVALTTVQLMRSEGTEGEAPVAAESTALAATVDDLEILTSNDELEMLQDMDFYAWLETQDTGAAMQPVSEAG